eukprot:3781836-Amphidinium_carterae.1
MTSAEQAHTRATGSTTDTGHAYRGPHARSGCSMMMFESIISHLSRYQLGVDASALAQTLQPLNFTATPVEWK